MRALLTLIVVAAVALVVGDRVAVVLAQKAIAHRIATEYSLARPPQVAIRGIPFLTQAASGTYHEVDLQVGDWSDEKIAVHRLDVTLTDVSAPLSDLLHGRTANITAATATATALVPYDTVRGFAPAGVESISSGPDGLHVNGTFSVEGIPVPAMVVVTVAPTDRGIEVTPVSVRAAAGGPAIPLALLRRTLAFVVPLHRLPLGARLTTITPAPDGLQVTAVARNPLS
ncbi:MAG: DUF2993 domain-containing protein [Mycobacteriaceae bacterium]|nr:DUF2993 domain-containing protein [Mycobacteriaceae bacterium]